MLKLRKNGRVFCITGWEAMKLHECLGEGNPYDRIVGDFGNSDKKCEKCWKKNFLCRMPSGGRKKWSCFFTMRRLVWMYWFWDGGDL